MQTLTGVDKNRPTLRNITVKLQKGWKRRDLENFRRQKTWAWRLEDSEAMPSEF